MKCYLLATFLLMFLANSIAQESEGDPNCAASNVAFIMDLSQTTSGLHTFEKYIVQKLVDKFPTKSRYGLVIFGAKAIVKAKFEPYVSATEFKAMVEGLSEQDVGPQHSYLDQAINKMSLPQMQFPIEKGRDKNVLFFLTDGRWTYNKRNISNPEEEIRKKMKYLIRQHVKVIVIALGRNPELRVLYGLVPVGREKTDIFYLKPNSKLNENLDKAATYACQEITKPECESKLDIGFIIDRSASINEKNNNTFDTKVKPSITGLAKYLKITKEGNHAGVEVFGDFYDTKVVIAIGSESNTKDFVKAVNEKVVYPWKSKQRTFINKALKIANENLFNYKHREGSKRYAVLVTDGQQTISNRFEKINSLEEARKLWKKKVKIIAIGVTKSVDETALKNLTNNGKNGKFEKIENFDQLKKTMKDIVSSFCNICKLKLVLVVDTSGSLSAGYKAEQYLLLDIARQMKMEKGGSQASVITFSDKGKLAIEFNPDGTQTITDFQTSVNALQFLKGRTAIESGLELVNKAMEIGPDKGFKKAVLVITDGLQDYNKLGEVERQSKSIRMKGYPIKTITLNKERWAKMQNEPKLPLRTLEAITGNEKDNYFLGYSRKSVSDQKFQNLVQSEVKKILRSFCGLNKKT